MYKKYHKFFLLSLCLVSAVCFSQAPINIFVKGKVTGRDQNDLLYQVMVINKRAGTGTFASSDGTFRVGVLKGDTLMFSASGYMIKKICFKDSVYKPEYEIAIRLFKISYYLKEVEIYPVKPLDEVQRNIEKLGVRNSDTYKNVDVLSSPITFLYERFSKFERSKRKVAEFENEDRRRDVLKDLFRIYIKYDIINLSNDDFDDFINYCHFSDEFIKTSTKYDLVMAIKAKYQQFEKIKLRR